MVSGAFRSGLKVKVAVRLQAEGEQVYSLGFLLSNRLEGAGKSWQRFNVFLYQLSSVWRW